jgi:hypothetical protein
MQRHLRSVREEETSRTRGYGDGAGAEMEPARHPHAMHDGHDHGHVPLFDASVSERYKMQWSDIQTGFVDDPRTAVEEANRLVGEVTDHLNETFMHNRNELERQWAAGEDASTEELRLALQRYRSFFQRLLSI